MVQSNTSPEHNTIIRKIFSFLDSTPEERIKKGIERVRKEAWAEAEYLGWSKDDKVSESGLFDACVISHEDRFFFESPKDYKEALSYACSLGSSRACFMFILRNESRYEENIKNLN